MKFRSVLSPLVALAFLIATCATAAAQSLATHQTWHYRLLHPSTLIDDCLICDRPTLILPLRGSFDLVLLEQNSLNTRYELTNIDFYVGSPDNPQYRVTGQGTWQIGGEVAVVQTVTLQTIVQAPSGSASRTFTNVSQQVQALWPEFEVDLNDTAGLGSIYRLHIVAAPLREVWLSTALGFNSTNGAGTVNAGDLISDTGRIVEPQGDLVRALGLPSGAYTIDAVDVAPGGSVLFSLNQDVTSPALGLLHNGDVFSDHGLIVETNQVLMAAFGLAPPFQDVGLKGLQVMDNGEVLFTINKDVAAKGSGLTLTHGDLLSNSGQIRKSNQNLLARFQPGTNANFGLKAFHLWPSGEVWFSVETGFNDTSLGPVGNGDLLSDQGFIVFDNVDLTTAFGPASTSANLGLTSLFVVTDVVPPVPAPVLLPPAVPPGSSTGNVMLSWSAQGKVFQVNKSAVLSTSFTPASPIVPGTNWTDFGALPVNPIGFYRLRQW